MANIINPSSGLSFLTDPRSRIWDTLENTRTLVRIHRQSTVRHGFGAIRPV